MKKRKKSNPIVKQKLASRETQQNYKEVEKVPRKRFTQMNVFERSSFLEELRRNNAFKRLKVLKKDDGYRYYNGYDWEIDDENWEKLIEVCGQCIKYCAEVKSKEKTFEENSDDSPKSQQGTIKAKSTIVDMKKLKAFLYANKKRKVTRNEVAAFCGVSSFSIVKREIEKEDDAGKLMDIIIDLRKANVGDCELKLPGKAKKKVSEKSCVRTTEKTSEVPTKTTEISTASESLEKVETTAIVENTKISKQFVSVESPKITEISTSLLEPEKEPILEEEHILKKEPIPEKAPIPKKEQKTTHNKNEKENAKKELPKKPRNIGGGMYKPVAKLSEIMIAPKKVIVKNFIFDESIFKLDTKIYQKLLQEIMSPNYRPVIWLFESQLFYLDKVKENYPVARDLLKFFAQDDDNKYTKLLQGEMPKADELGKFCKNNDIILVSGKAPNIVWCKVNDVKVIIPNYFKNLHRSPFTGNEIIGIDSCVMGAPYMKSIFPKTKTVWISDIQLQERGFSESEFYTVLAYYGKFGRAEMIDGHHDKSIINFYKQNGVEKVYGADYGFKVFAKLVGLEVELIYVNEQMNSRSTSTMLEVIKSKSSTVPEEVLKFKSGNFIKLDSIIEICCGRLRIFVDNKNVDISVYDSRKRQKKSPLRFIEVEKNDVITVCRANTVLIIEVVIAADAIGKILYYGDEKNIPKNLLKI